jgi:CelD/BcsL family acetyltransferase involved in cellulose biosynthesis
LPDREELFISGLSHNRRSALKRKEKKLEKEHGFSFLSINDVGQLGEAFDTFVALHQKLWRSRGFPGMFKRKDFLEFHRNVARRLFESGWLRIYFLSVKGKPVASLYGFQYAGKFYYYQSGFDPHWKGYGVGKILLNHTILEAIRNKLNEYDFLRGETDYKFDFTDTFRRTIHILAAQNTHKANFYIFTKEMLRWTKNSAKKFFPNNLLSRARKIKDNITLR